MVEAEPGLLVGRFGRVEVGLAKRDAGMVKIAWLVQACVRVTQIEVDINRTLKASRVVFAQPLPLFVGTVGTEDATGTRHRERKVAILAQPVPAMPQSHLALNERKLGA